MKRIPTMHPKLLIFGSVVSALELKFHTGCQTVHAKKLMLSNKLNEAKD